ncbi:hypothetical protein HYALB_00004012 [Hymenoscyphus albidus]|uniref:Alkaline phytoceramidase n=1 Tax=Hymenoscyphus albidus TaxID=595503 RepID=A0A9N9M1X2_9HELO|nr:hypothetical protein HYALB_00004012 [Hymenoscyphus albidus]
MGYLGIAGVGIGSGLFHATLKNYTQWCDDLSMLVATATVIHRVFTFDKSLTYTVVHGAILIACFTAFSTWHCIKDELIMHSVIFGIMIAVVGLKTRSIINARVTDPAVRKDVRLLTAWGGLIFVTGFAIWNVDNAMCSQLTAIKRTIGMPWSFVIELHGWWHIFTGMGAYIFIALVEYLTSEEAGQPLGTRFAWPVGSIIAGRGSETKENGNESLEHVNGSGNSIENLKHTNGNTNGVVDGNGKSTGGVKKNR